MTASGLLCLFQPLSLLPLAPLPLTAQDGIVLVNPLIPPLVMALDLLVIPVDIALPQTTGATLLILKRHFHFFPLFRPSPLIPFPPRATRPLLSRSPLALAFHLFASSA
jgi:hypothetical protein